MKGFGSRERNGLMAFLCLVAVLLALGPIADRVGCTRRYVEPPQSGEMVGTVADSASVADSMSSAHKADSLVKSDSVRGPKKRIKRKPRHRRQADPQRRSFLDEPL